VLKSFLKKGLKICFVHNNEKRLPLALILLLMCQRKGGKGFDKLF